MVTRFFGKIIHIKAMTMGCYMMNLSVCSVAKGVKVTPGDVDALRLYVQSYLGKIEKSTDDYEQECELCKSFAYEQIRILSEKYSDDSAMGMIKSIRKVLASYVIEMNTGEPVGEDFDFDTYFDGTKNIEECQDLESCLSLLISDVYGETEGIEEEKDGYRYLCILLGQHMDESMIDKAYVAISGIGE